MAAVLRADGKAFDVDRFCAATRLAADAVYRRGEPVFPATQPDGRRHDRSGVHIVVSEATFDDLPGQVREATAFLLTHRADVAELVGLPGVEGVVLDFGITRRDVAVQCDVLPPELVRAAGALGLGIELSHYPAPDETSPDADLVAAHADRLLPLATATLHDSYYYASLPLCVIDAVYSINARYAGVVATVGRYCDWAGVPRYRPDRGSLPPPAGQEPVTAFCERFERAGLDDMTAVAFRNRQRTSPRGGILKADAVYRFASALRRHKVEFFQDVPGAADNEALAGEIRSIPGQGSGLSLGYFWMLAGSDDNVKPDRMVLRFLSAVLGRAVRVDEAQRLLRAATTRLRPKHPHLTPRLLDFVVWNYQREETD